MECSKSTDPEGSGIDPRCGLSRSNFTDGVPSASNPPASSYLEGNTRVCSYFLITMGICPYEHVISKIWVQVDTSAVTEGMTVSGKVTWGLYEENFTPSLTHNNNNSGQSIFEGQTDVGLMAFAPDSAYCITYALIKFPTKGSEAADLNYLYSKVESYMLGCDYYLWKPQTVYF